MQTAERLLAALPPPPDAMARLLTAAMDTIDTGVTISDMQQPDQPLIYVNKGFEALTGYPAQAMLGRNCRFLQGPERDQDALPIVRKALCQGESCSVILRNYRQDGTPFWNELFLYPLHDQQGRLTHYVGIQHDISEIVDRSRRLITLERQLAQEAAQHAQSLTLLNDMSRQLNVAATEAAIGEVARQWMPQLLPAAQIRLVLRSQADTHLISLTLTHPAQSLWESISLPRTEEEQTQALFTHAYAIAPPGETARPAQQLSFLLTPLMAGGRLLGVLAMRCDPAAHFTQREEHLFLQVASMLATNIQSRRLFAQMQAALEENTSLYQAAREHNHELQNALEQLHNAQAQLIAVEKMASLGRLVAGLAHEINTPIGIAVTAASIWEDRSKELWQLYRNGQMKRADFEEFFQMLTESGQLITNNLQRAADLIYSFKQVAVDQSSEAVRAINLKHYLQEVVTSLRPELKRTKLQVAVSGDDTLVLQSYPGALSQIMTNLIMNSVTHAYAPDTVGHLTIQVARQGDNARLTYADDGKGISPEDQDKLFEPFFTTRRGQGGSGLGLHIVYNLVTQKLDGTIHVQSQVGAGTTFTLTLPLSSGTEDSGQRIEDSGQRTEDRGQKLLL
ncbi:MAG: PAS domain-containing protein [Caldilineaceae bacterium]|nr:PAS domain-containing protein [Caldilineaceae bacterium]